MKVRIIVNAILNGLTLSFFAKKINRVIVFFINNYFTWIYDIVVIGTLYALFLKQENENVFFLIALNNEGFVKISTGTFYIQYIAEYPAVQYIILYE